MYDLICAEFAVTSDDLKLPQFWKLLDLEAIHLVKQVGNCRVNIDPRPMGLQPNEWWTCRLQMHLHGWENVDNHNGINSTSYCVYKWGHFWMLQTPNRLTLVFAASTATKSNTVAGSVKNNNNKPQKHHFSSSFSHCVKVRLLFVLSEGRGIFTVRSFEYDLWCKKLELETCITCCETLLRKIYSAIFTLVSCIFRFSFVCVCVPYEKNICHRAYSVS